MDTQTKCQLVGHSPFVARVVVEFIGPNVGCSRDKEIPNRAARVTEQHAGDCVPASACGGRIIGKTSSKRESAERTLSWRASRFAYEPLPDVESKFQSMFAFLPAHIGNVLEHMLATNQRLRSCVTKPDIAARTNDRGGRLERIARVTAGYLRPYRIRQFFRQEKLAKLGETESVFGDQRRAEDAVVSEYSVLATNIVWSGEAVFIAANAGVERIGNMQIGVVDRVSPEKGLARL